METPTYEAASARLEAIIARLDSGEAGLRETLELCREGRTLVEFCAGRARRGRPGARGAAARRAGRAARGRRRRSASRRRARSSGRELSPRRIAVERVVELVEPDLARGVLEVRRPQVAGDPRPGLDALPDRRLRPSRCPSSATPRRMNGSTVASAASMPPVLPDAATARAVASARAARPASTVAADAVDRARPARLLQRPRRVADRVLARDHRRGAQRAQEVSASLPVDATTS